ncbi:MAG: thioredoxin family protein [Deltaproteobacteria bacterium]|nr:thioredoxin family protein [Deltaproteobacteria bacterium]
MRLVALAGLLVCMGWALACNAPPVAPQAKPASVSPLATPVKAAAAGPRFVEDDIDAAFRQARESGRVVFVDGWAPWCHTCLSMQRDVLHDPRLARYEDRVVFAAIDTDRPEAASFLVRFPLKGWPGLFVIDPQTDQALALHAGSLSFPEFEKLLDDALATRDPRNASEPQVKAILEGHAAMGRKDYASAARHYEDAVAAGGPRLPEAALGAMRALFAREDLAGCIDFGMRTLGAFRTSSSSADVIAYVVACARRLKEGDPKRIAALFAARAALEPLTTAPPPGASVDDKADALAVLADIAEMQKDEAARKAAHEKRLELLEADVAAQKDVEHARIHDYARMTSYLALGRGDEAVKMLKERTSQLPGSYEAWARLASAYHEIKRDDDAIPAVQKAIELSYGPRRLRYLTLLADILAAQKDVSGERKTVQALIDDAEKLPPGQRDDATIATAKDRLAKLPKSI